MDSQILFNDPCLTTFRQDKTVTMTTKIIPYYQNVIFYNPTEKSYNSDVQQSERRS